MLANLRNALRNFDTATLAASSTLYGALDCAHGWKYVASKPSAIVAPHDAIALTVSAGASTTLVQDFAITAVDAQAASGSSVGVA